MFVAFILCPPWYRGGAEQGQSLRANVVLIDLVSVREGRSTWWMEQQRTCFMSSWTCAVHSALLHSKGPCVWLRVLPHRDRNLLDLRHRIDFRLPFMTGRTICPINLITKLGFVLNYERIFACIWPRVRYCRSFLMMCLPLVFILDLISRRMSANASIIVILLSGRKEIKPHEVTSKLWIWYQRNKGPTQDWWYSWRVGT